MKTKFTKKRWWLSGIITCVILFASLFLYWQTTKPQDIGRNMEYLGEVNFGCSWVMGILTFGFCGDREENHSYFFATDMKEEEVERYFKKARLVNKTSSHTKSESVYYTYVYGNEGANSELYFNLEALNSSYGTQFVTDKPRILRMDAVSYKILKNSY